MADWRMPSEVSEEIWLISSMARLISSLAADCCSLAVAMERTWSEAASTRETISRRASPDSPARTVASSILLTARSTLAMLLRVPS